MCPPPPPPPHSPTSTQTLWRLTSSAASTAPPSPPQVAPLPNSTPPPNKTTSGPPSATLPGPPPPLPSSATSSRPSPAAPVPSPPSPSLSSSPPTAAASSPPPVLISAVDIHYKNKLIFTEVQETETLTGWFRCSPFRIDLLDTKDVIPTTVCHPNSDEASAELAEEISLSWVLIDPVGRRAANLSSQKAVSVERHWLTGEVQVRFASILAGGNRRGSTSDLVQCGIGDVRWWIGGGGWDDAIEGGEFAGGGHGWNAVDGEG
ncbi:hypothetical protein TEA_012593 [Camellia sinensis var. sinensis]|uniref:Uncharacterized protein n=1 Tax=Camellia sinensis var. sinensis TaxID=542762 RepID=A0A4S4EZ33_CAMSN|nr:hypothetical protein TEA_012593 [Camellia sinensis var. sinensis]